MLNPQSSLKGIARGDEDKDIAFSLLTIAREFKMSYHEMLEIPIPALGVYADFLKKVVEENKAEQRRLKNK